MRLSGILFPTVVLAAFLSGCGGGSSGYAGASGMPDTAPGAPLFVFESADGIEEMNGAEADLGHAPEGYVSVRCMRPEDRMKCRILKDERVYTYDLRSDGGWDVYPLQMGAGAYELQVLSQEEGSLYRPVADFKFEADPVYEDVYAAYPNQQDWYGRDSYCVSLSESLCAGITDSSKKAETLYDYVSGHIMYDDEKAATVLDGYTADPDETLLSGKGICLDYSAVLGSMLRAQGIHARLVIGWAGEDGGYHAWNQAYVDGEWKVFDSTFGRDYQLKDEEYVEERRY